MIDIFLKLTGTQVQARTVLDNLGLGDVMLRRDEAGELQFAGFTHDIAMLFIPNLLLVRATYDEEGEELTPPVLGGPHLMVRFVSETAIRKARRFEAGGLPPGLEVVPSPGTIKWAGDE